MNICKTCGMAAAGDPECIKACVLLARDAVMWRQRYDEMVVTCAQTAKERDALLDGPDKKQVVCREYADALQEALNRRTQLFEGMIDRMVSLRSAAEYMLTHHNVDPDGAMDKLREALGIKED